MYNCRGVIVGIIPENERINAVIYTSQSRHAIPRSLFADIVDPVSMAEVRPTIHAHVYSVRHHNHKKLA